MANLSEPDRAEVTAKIQRLPAWAAIPCSITKADLKAAVDATDAWIDSNAAAFNLALPLPARTNLSQGQKTLLFCYVALKRAGILQ